MPSLRTCGCDVQNDASVRERRSTWETSRDTARWKEIWRRDADGRSSSRPRNGDRGTWKKLLKGDR